jgi:hypothetical protein
MIGAAVTRSDLKKTLMPAYLCPGIRVEAVVFRPKRIGGVNTTPTST